MKCRHCYSNINLSFVELGSAPPSNCYLSEQSLQSPETYFPLSVLVCEQCWLVQTADFAKPNELFDADYAYFSGTSNSWLNHCERYVLNMIERFSLDHKSHVIEVAANDGHLLQFFQKLGIPCMGVEPTSSTAGVAREKGITIIESFFGSKLAEELVFNKKQADLITANNVLAHVPDINDFVTGFSFLLKPQGVCTFEFPHLINLVRENQFDTIYHEHFSYLSLTVIEKIFSANGLAVFDVEKLSTHGGSLRVFAQRAKKGIMPRSERVETVLREEKKSGISTPGFYSGFQKKTEKVKNDFLEFLLQAKKDEKTVGAYGAAAKGNTMLNFAGIRSDLISFVVDRSESKQNKYMPGSRIPIVSEEMLSQIKPDYVVILPWNLREEITAQLKYIRDWNARFVTAVPNLSVF